MFLNNFYNLLKQSLFAVGNNLKGDYSQVPDAPLVDITGSSNNGYVYGVYTSLADTVSAGGVASCLLGIQAYANVYGDTWGYYVALGSGGEEVDQSDYSLSNMITSFRMVGRDKWTISTDKTGIIFSGLVTNSLSSEVVVKEAGLILKAEYAWTQSSVSAHNVLFAREVLETPITIPGGQSAMVSFKIKW